MENIIKDALIFTAGALVGVCIAYRYTNNQANDRANKEIEEARKEYEEALNEEMKKESEDISKENGYEPDPCETTDTPTPLYSEPKVEEKKPAAKKKGGNSAAKKFEVISDDDFNDAEHAEYDKVFLDYYADNILADEMQNKIEASVFEKIIGKNFANHFGEKDDPEVLHIRNSKLTTDYEITKDPRLYSEVTEEIYGNNEY
jgi:hypothetical protein